MASGWFVDGFWLASGGLPADLWSTLVGFCLASRTLLVRCWLASGWLLGFKLVCGWFLNGFWLATGLLFLVAPRLASDWHPVGFWLVSGWFLVGFWLAYG